MNNRTDNPTAHTPLKPGDGIAGLPPRTQSVGFAPNRTSHGNIRAAAQ